LEAEIVESESVYQGWTCVSKIALQMPDGAVVERHIEDHGVAITVLPYDPNRRTALLVSMPRAPVIQAGQPDLLEAIAGSLEAGEEPTSCVRREAMEEAGVLLEDLEKVATVWSMPSLSTERIHLYLARYSERECVGPGGGASGEHENITVRELPLNELWELAVRDGLQDMKTLVLLQALKLKSPQLFD
jgi:nudix-type nucleoside diphosphatase (YffH/AdpP family)